jgi:hypothetical protein
LDGAAALFSSTLQVLSKTNELAGGFPRQTDCDRTTLHSVPADARPGFSCEHYTSSQMRS